jgi:integrase
LLQLEWSRVDLDKRVIRILDTKNGEGRSVPLTLKAVEILSNLPKRQGFEQMVFPLTANALKLGFQRALERSRIDDLRFHDLRHEAVSRFFEKGLNVMEVASISGHKTLQMLKRYTHMQVGLILEKIDRL